MKRARRKVLAVKFQHMAALVSFRYLLWSLLLRISREFQQQAWNSHSLCRLSGEKMLKETFLEGRWRIHETTQKKLSSAKLSFVCFSFIWLGNLKNLADSSGFLSTFISLTVLVSWARLSFWQFWSFERVYVSNSSGYLSMFISLLVVWARLSL